MKISSKEFKNLVYYSQHLKKVQYFFCDIDTMDLEFINMPDCQIEELNFYGTGKTSGWGTDPTKFNSLIKAISNSGLKNSLRKILIKDCYISEEDCKQMMNKHNLYDIEIVGYFASYFSNHKYSITLSEDKTSQMAD
mmetsp:Transcript_22119/g.19670  ORF Transcript_22119/g.19670 Transcript_22119/m.19670 type:complete len:137 (+) Transcript_22119:440-850(+)